MEGVSLTSDGRTLYFTRFKFTQNTNVFFCTLQVVSLDVVTGDWRVIAQGGRPAISPDGRKLAYVAVGGGKDCTETLGSVVVRDLVTGRERRWEGRREPGGFEGDIMRFAWSPDSVHLALQRNIGDPYHEIRILDTRKGDDVLDTPLISPREESWGEVSYLDHNSLLIASSGLKGDNVDGEHLIYSVDLDSGRRRRIVDMPSGVTSIDFDDSRRHLLIVLNDYRDGKQVRSVWAWHDGKLARIIRSGEVIQAVWRG